MACGPNCQGDRILAWRREVPCFEIAEIWQGLLSIGFHSDYIGEPLRALIRPGDIYDVKTSLVTVCGRVAELE